MANETDFNITNDTSYSIHCEPCGAGTGPWTTRYETRLHAKRLGFVAFQTPDDGVLNFCSACSKELDITAKGE